jgi:6-phosphofructokinase 2
MIATVTLNPSLDIHITVHGLVVDGTNRWTNSRLYAGGKGIDVSRAIHEMGGYSAAYGFIGGSPGRQVEILLDKEGVPYNFTPIRLETRTNFIITDTKNSQQTRIDAPGPRISREEFERFQSKLRQVHPKPDIIVVGGSVPRSVPANVYHDLIVEAKGYDVKCSLDSDGQWLEEGIKAKPYLIKPNVREAEALLKTELSTEAAIIEAAIYLVKTGIEIVVISRGKDGLIAATKRNIVKAVPPEVKVRSAVGAGDCTITGLILKLVRNESLIEACRLAAAMGTATVLTPGTELCHRADVERLLPQIRVWEVAASPRSKAIFPET